MEGKKDEEKGSQNRKGKGKKSKNLTLEPKPKTIKVHSRDIVWQCSQNNELLAMAIGDRKVFHLVSTIHNATKSMVSVPSKYKCDWWVDAVLDYNYRMKAVDLGDKIVKSYKMNRKTQQWPTKLVFHLGNMAMMNAYLLWKQSQQAQLTNMIMKEQRTTKNSAFEGEFATVQSCHFLVHSDSGPSGGRKL